MEAKHIFSDHIYVISNHVVASNPLFYKSYYSKRFLTKMDEYLSPLCEILAYSFRNEEFQLIVRMNKRSEFVKVYKNRRKARGKSWKKVPHSNYIFSQAMANLQSSTAIHFNRKEGRTGALFARRFRKILVKGEVQLSNWMESLKNMKRLHNYSKRWKSRVKGFRKKHVKKWYVNSLNMEGESIWKRPLKSQESVDKSKLQGHFKNLPPLKVSRRDLLKFLEIRHEILII